METTLCHQPPLPRRPGAIGIVRVSQINGREGESFESPAEQRARIEAACELDGMRLLSVVEGVVVAAVKQAWAGTHGLEPGQDGEDGSAGEKGDTGAVGQDGEKGDAGPQGAGCLNGGTGPMGPPGPVGPKGDVGTAAVKARSPCLRRDRPPRRFDAAADATVSFRISNGTTEAFPGGRG